MFKPVVVLPLLNEIMCSIRLNVAEENKMADLSRLLDMVTNIAIMVNDTAQFQKPNSVL